MSQPFPDHHKEFADGMGISLYQKLSLGESASILGCTQCQLEAWSEDGNIESIQLPDGEPQFFGYQLVSYLLSCTTTEPIKTASISNPDRIIRSKELEKMVALSRPTIWRYEKAGDFPKRIKLGTSSSVGWKLSEVQAWINQR